MSEPKESRQQLTKPEYSPIGSSRKLNLLLQRSLRYSYRQRCCGCCPTILCELLFPFILIALIALARYGTNTLEKKMNDEPGYRRFDRPQCSQYMNTTTTLSNDLFTKCFTFPPSYSKHERTPSNTSIIPDKTNLVFQPMTNETKELAERAKERLKEMNCNNTEVW
jgi:hypothetical protein